MLHIILVKKWLKIWIFFKGSRWKEDIMFIRLQDVTKILDRRIIISSINYEFESGNIYGIVGQNGSGKTMLLRAISGLICLSQGTITVDGKVLSKDISFPPNMGIIIEKPELLPYLSGLENLKLLAEIRNKISEDDIKYYMEKFGLSPDSKQIVKKYSLGMKQKLGVIQAIMENPSLLLLDEPFNALDAESVDVLRSILLKYKEQGKLIILTSHHQEDILSVCNQIIHLQDGHILD